jgi:5'-nucleotidase/UDP-sugar diphosphatase
MAKNSLETISFRVTFKLSLNSEVCAQHPKKEVCMKIYPLLLNLFFTTSVFAEVIQVLHTNDLHSHFEQSPQRPDVGGYARLKKLMQDLKLEALKNGMGSISMDAGDFMEGSIFYLADKGRKSFEAFDKLEHDVAIIGNHDYLMAPTDLEAIFKDVPPSRPLLAANLEISAEYPNINKHIKPVWEGKVGGVKVGVIGITTNDLLYKWRLQGEGKIYDEVRVTKRWAKFLRERGAEIIVALTHIGIKNDKNLAKNVPELDVIVGGHSHSELKEVVYQKTDNNKLVPIVQAGNHGEWLGKLILNYDRATRSVKVLNYELVPVNNPTKDQEIISLIKDANEELNKEFGEEWLNETIGQSHLRTTHKEDDKKIWQYFINDAMMESTNADFAIHAPALSGDNYPLGAVTRRSLFEGNPRSFDFSDKYGYSVYTARIMGSWIKVIASVCLKFNLPLYFAGLQVKYTKNADGQIQILELRKDNKIINPFKFYKVAFSEGIVRGAYEISQLTRFLIQDGRKEQIPMWIALEEKLRRDQLLTPNYLNRPGRGLASEKSYERMMIPASED